MVVARAGEASRPSDIAAAYSQNRATTRGIAREVGGLFTPVAAPCATTRAVAPSQRPTLAIAPDLRA